MDAGTVALLAGAGFGAGAVNAVARRRLADLVPRAARRGLSERDGERHELDRLLPGYLGGSLAYRRELALQRARIRALAPTAWLGAAAGTALLLVSPAALFEAIVPWLILAACALLALQPRVARGRARVPRRAAARLALHAGLFPATLYGGYFGAGLGIVLLAILGASADDGLQRLNALKGLMSLLVAIVCAAGFALLGPVAWDAAPSSARCLPAAWPGCARPAPAGGGAARRRHRLRRRGGDRAAAVGTGSCC